MIPGCQPCLDARLRRKPEPETWLPQNGLLIPNPEHARNG